MPNPNAAVAIAIEADDELLVPLASVTSARYKSIRGGKIWRGGRSIDDLQSLTGLRAQYISRALDGRFIPRLDKFKLLARALNKSVHDLAVELEITDPPPLVPRIGFYLPVDATVVNRTLVSNRTGLSLSYISRILSETCMCGHAKRRHEIPEGRCLRGPRSKRTGGVQCSCREYERNPNDPERRQPRVVDLAILAKHFRCSMDHLIRCWQL